MSRRCVFLDRDGVINQAPRAGAYIGQWSDFRLLPNITDWIRIFNSLDYLVIVVTNQRCIARGVVPGEAVDEIHSLMAAELARRGARIDDIYCCPHEEDSCSCRKPRPGMVLEAQRKWDIDLRRSLMIGDSDRDEALAARCGMTFLRVDGGRVV